jgi:hypothetical protein
MITPATVDAIGPELGATASSPGPRLQEFDRKIQALGQASYVPSWGWILHAVRRRSASVRSASTPDRWFMGDAAGHGFTYADAGV